MPVKHRFRQLRKHFSFATELDARAFVAEMAARSTPGTATVILLDADRRLCDLLIVSEGGAEHLDDVLLAARFLRHRGARFAVLVTDRTGEVPADRPDDELQWMELVELGRSLDLTVLDWFVTWEMQAFSVAEFAPIPAQW